MHCSSLRRVLSFVLALLPLAVAVVSAPAQSGNTLTTITAAHLSQNLTGAPLASGQLCLTPVNQNGVPAGFEANGVQYPPAQQCYPITNGAVSNVLVPDTATAQPSGLGFQVQVQNAAGTPLYNFAQPIYPTGATWSLDTWSPIVSALVTSPTVSYAASAPQGRCGVSPAIRYTATAVYNCVNQIWVASSASSGTANALPLNGGSMIGMLSLYADPTSPLQAATKQYVDWATAAASSAVQSASLPLSGGTVSGAIVLPADPTAALQASTKEYVDAAAAAAQSAATSASLPLAGGTLTGALTLPSDPTANLQAATKQYVDAHAGGAASVTQASVADAFHSTTTVTNTVLSTTYNEGAAGATLAGTKPATYTGPDTGWHFGDPSSTAWNFGAGGGVTAPVATAAPYLGGAYIDTGLTNLTVNASFSSIGTASLIVVRYTDEHNAVFINLTSGMQAQIFSVTNDTQTAISSPAQMDPGSLHISVSGQTVTVTDDAGHTPLTGAIPAGVNTSGTNVGFATYQGTTGTMAKFSVTSAPTQQNVPCVGYINADDTCSGTGSSALAAYDSVGHLSSLPEVQVSTDTSGVSTIACQEDKGRGIFDARCAKYGNGGILGANSGQALEDLRNAVICYQAETGKHASVSLPPGQFHVGTPTNPTLNWPAGSYLTGVPNGEGTSTFLLATYNNYNVFQVNTGQSAVCSDGQTHTSQLNNGSTRYLAAYGCGSGGCVNFPGDNGNYPSGGPNQGGMFIGDSQGDEEHLGAFNNGGYGITADGQDSHFAYLFTQLNNEWLLYGKDQPGQTYDPTTDGVHGDVVSTGVDNQVDHVEAYGTFGGIGKEYGHLALFVWAGGNTQVSDLFLQVGEIGLYRSFANGGFGRLVNSRFDYMHGESIVSAGGGDVYSNLAIDGYCDNQAVITALGHCDGIDLGSGGNTLTNLIMNKNNGQFQGSIATGDVWGDSGNNFGIGTQALNFEIPATEFRTLGAVNKPFSPSPNTSTGDNPDVSVNNVLAPQDTTPITIHGVNPDAFLAQHVYVLTGNCNVTLAGPQNGGHWHGNNNADISLCSSNPVNGPFGAYAGFLDFLVVSGTIYGEPPEMIEQSDPPQNLTVRPVPATPTDSCNDADFTFGPGTAKAGGGFGIYRCHPANTWTFYPLTATSF